MKKTYIAPSLTVENVENADILTASTLNEKMKDNFIDISDLFNL